MNADSNGDIIDNLPQPILNPEDPDMYVDGNPMENAPQPIWNLEDLSGPLPSKAERSPSTSFRS
jgi:hypothetical protein